MEIQIDDKTRLRITDEYFAPMKWVKNKNKRIGDSWVEYKWFSKLESCIRYLTQKKLAEKKVVVQLSEFITMYKEAREEIRSLLTANGLV